MLYGYDAGVLGGIQNEKSFRDAIGVGFNSKKACRCCHD